MMGVVGILVVCSEVLLERNGWSILQHVGRNHPWPPCKEHPSSSKLVYVHPSTCRCRWISKVPTVVLLNQLTSLLARWANWARPLATLGLSWIPSPCWRRWKIWVWRWNCGHQRPRFWCVACNARDGPWRRESRRDISCWWCRSNRSRAFRTLLFRLFLLTLWFFWAFFWWVKKRWKGQKAEGFSGRVLGIKPLSLDNLKEFRCW